MSDFKNNSLPLLEVKNISHSYGNKLVVSIDSWHLMKNEHQLLIGPSGSGKTTLLGILSGLLRPTQGSVTALETVLTDISITELSTFRARNYGFVFQDHNLISSLTVGQNLELACSLAGVDVDESWADYLLNNLGIIEYKNSNPIHLSHGEAQRAAIARAAVTKPSLLLADEPTSSLDDENASRVMELLKTLSEEAGSTMLVASHDSRIKPFFPTSYTLAKIEERLP